MTNPLKHYLTPLWDAPANIRAFSTTREAGFSEGGFAYFNLGNHVNDNSCHVEQNRQKLMNDLHLPSKPTWLNQVHGCEAISLDSKILSSPTADAVYTKTAGKVCAILTADCLPILLADCQGQAVAAIHGGWRGLAKGVIDETIKLLQTNPANLLAWLGPAIGPDAFQIGPEVREAFLQRDKAYQAGFKRHNDSWYGDLQALATINLNRLGVTKVYASNSCTYKDSQRFYSYRREGKQTGRMATLIWIQNP